MSENLITSELIKQAELDADNLLKELESESTSLTFKTARADNICDIIKQIDDILSRVIAIIKWIPLPPVKKVVDILEKLLEILKRLCQ